jgi:arylsulfatase A-like enzyme
MFTNAFVVNSLCCPSRSSILTGQYSHSTGVYSNTGQYGGWQAFRPHEASTIAVWLKNAGYDTALIGKYLNGYSGTTEIPPGWDRWFAWETGSGGFFYNYTINDNGALRFYGSDPSDYSTRVLTREAVSFIDHAQSPFFLYLALYAPKNGVPDPRDASAFPDLKPYRPPNYNEADVSDKPAWVQNLPPLTRWRRAAEDRRRLDQYRTLLGADRAVRHVVHALNLRGELNRTMIVFTSDNGLAWGEHRWTNKLSPYEESIRVPYVVRYDPLTQLPRPDSHLVTNIDLAPTWADLAGIAAPGAEGTSLLPLLSSPFAHWRSDFLVEHLQNHDPIPTYCAVRNERYMYVAYGTGEKELYDLSADPFELRNREADGTLASVRNHMWRRLKSLCKPPPPGYTVPPSP